jgi:hypothetical protein
MIAGFQQDRIGDYCPGLRSSRWRVAVALDLPESQGEKDRDDRAAHGFLCLLAELRTILLQDSVLLRREVPGHPMWDHEIFQRLDYVEFAARLQQSMSPAFALTEYKVQGSTYRYAVLDLARRTYGMGETAAHSRHCSGYVQLSRLQTMNNLWLLEHPPGFSDSVALFFSQTTT